MTRFIANVRRHRLHILFVALVALVGVALWLRPWHSSSPSHVPQAQWLQVEPQLLESQLGLVGRIQAASQVTLAAPFDGVVREVLVQEGQRVEIGQTLITLDPSQIEMQLRQAEAELLKVRREAQRLQDWENSQEVARARRTVSNAKQTVAHTQANLRDTQTLFSRGIVARMEVDALTQQAYMQRQDLIAAQEELKAVLARGDGEERKIVEMELANAHVRYQKLKLQYERQDIKAPVQGYIVRPAQIEGSKPVTLQPGVQVSQGLPLLNVIEQDHFQVITRVEETDLHQLRRLSS